MNISRFLKIQAALCLVPLSMTMAGDLNKSLKTGKAELKSAGALAFGPDGVLFVGDTQAGAIWALGTNDTQKNNAMAAIDVENLGKKVADKLESLFKEDRAAFEAKWEDISVFVKYGMLTEDKFFDKAKKFFLLKNTKGTYSTLEEYKEKVKATLTDKDEKLVYLYTSNADLHDSQITSANAREYDVLVFDHPIDSHLVQRLESAEEGVSIKRVDAAPISELINKDEKAEEVLSKKEVEKVLEAFKALVDDKTFKVENKALSPQDPPIIITQDEFMRRMKEMSAMSGQGMMGMDAFPDSYNLVVNTNHELSRKLASLEGDSQSKLARYAVDLAKLSNGLLKGAELTRFVNESLEMVK